VIRLQDFLGSGINNMLSSRQIALVENLRRFVAEQGQIVLEPFMLLALWTRRRDTLLSGFILYAIGLHIAMTLVFSFPGYRGGLFHSSAALLPFWAALGITGLDDVLAWIAPRRRWKLTQAKMVFGTALVIWAIVFTASTLPNKIVEFNSAESHYRWLAQKLPPNSTVIINYPPELYYYAGIPGIAIPNASPDVIPELARRYGVNILILDNNVTLPFRPVYEGKQHVPFLEQILDEQGVKIYRIVREHSE
jgi:hypothetical protein